MYHIYSAFTQYSVLTQLQYRKFSTIVWSQWRKLNCHIWPCNLRLTSLAVCCDDTLDGLDCKVPNFTEVQMSKSSYLLSYTRHLLLKKPPRKKLLQGSYLSMWPQFWVLTIHAKKGANRNKRPLRSWRPCRTWRSRMSWRSWRLWHMAHDET